MDRKTLRRELDFRDSETLLGESRCSDEEEFDFESEKYTQLQKTWPQGTSSLWRYCLGVLIILCFDMIFQVTSALSHIDVSSGSAPAPVDACYCGTSIQEAKALDCIYDELAIGWLPPQCRDSELTMEFHTAGPNNTIWPYFADEEATLPLTLEDVALLSDTGEPFYTTHYWYLVHCNYNWRKLMRTITTGVVMDLRNNNEAHTRNCGDLGIKYRMLSLNGISTQAYNSFGYI